MSKKIILPFLCIMIFLIASSLSNAYVLRNVTAERQAEWERYEQYKTDYVKFYGLEGFEQYLDESNLQKSFGFKPASYYYVPQSILQLAYNPPLQGDAYYTENRGYTSSLYQPSAVKYYGTEINGKETGYIPSTHDGVYFDHPQINGGTGYLTVNYPSYSNYGYNSYNYYGYNNYNYYGYNSYSSITQPNYYARVAQPLTGNYYVVGFY
jgi:hypothetical protein